MIKKGILAILISIGAISASIAQEYKVVTIVESIIPAGIGRSRIIENKTNVNAGNFTTERTNGKKSKQGDIDRGDLRVDEFSETKLLNFFSIAGINFQNIASNDAIITSKINNLIQEGWDLKFVVSGVESDAGQTDGNGIYITRLFFRKDK